MKKINLSPSILTADFTNLHSVIKELENASVDYLHLDIMDGVFVPPITFGSKVVADIKNITSLPLDCHLMVVNPEHHITDFANAGASIISVHIEGNTHVHRLLMQIKSFNIETGIVLNPHTNANQIENIIDYVDNILIMSVNPGYGGQSFIEGSYKKIEAVRKMIENSGKQIKLSVDGGVNIKNIKAVVSAGADFIIAGSAIVNSSNIKESVLALRSEI